MARHIVAGSMSIPGGVLGMIRRVVVAGMSLVRV
jgi:hypothetical protein